MNRLAEAGSTRAGGWKSRSVVSGFLVLVGVLAAAAPARAQFQQYVEPGAFEEERETMDELLDRAMQSSRWRAGQFFIDPWFGLRNATYIDNVFATTGADKESDFTVTIGAGLRLFRPVGSEMTFAAHALPEYVWWQELTERRRLNGRYGAGLFGNFGRTGLEVSATRSEDAQFFSRELETPVNTRYDIGQVNLEIVLGAGVSLFAGGELRLIRYLDEDEPLLADLDVFDRDEEIFRGGLRFSPGESFSIGVGAELSTVDFDTISGSGVNDRSNSGTSPILQLEFAGTLFDFSANLAARELEPEDGSSFVPYEEITGTARLQMTSGGRLRPQLYANNNLVYSLDQRWAYFDDFTVGLALQVSLGQTASVRLFAEQGTNDYTRLDSGEIDRQDDLEVVGAEIRVNFGRVFLNLGASRTDYDSNFDAFDREVTVVRSGLGLSQIGGGSPWG